jgi:hypothetical protein
VQPTLPRAPLTLLSLPQTQPNRLLTLHSPLRIAQFLLLQPHSLALMRLPRSLQISATSLTLLLHALT